MCARARPSGGPCGTSSWLALGSLGGGGWRPSYTTRCGEDNDFKSLIPFQFLF